MSDGIVVSVRQDGTVQIVTTVGNKRAAVVVTPEYAQNLAARLMMATANFEPGKDAKGRYRDA